MITNYDHPYWHVRNIAINKSIIRSLTLSYYIYRPQSSIDERETITISREQFLNFNYIQDIANFCPKDRNLAIHSLVECHDRIYRHIPMIDMSTQSRAHLQKLRFFLQEDLFHEFIWFESGRSFHGYGSSLLTHDEWISFMGQLLLSNQKDLKPTVDPRWIGHRLIAGYSALRWTNNTFYYLKYPTLITP